MAARSYDREDNRKAVTGLGIIAEDGEGEVLCAGLPILEVIRKLEQEKILSKDERGKIRSLLNNGEKRIYLIKCLNEVEMGTNTKFSIRRLKALIHSNGAGLPTPVLLPNISLSVTALNPERINDDESSFAVSLHKQTRKEKDTASQVSLEHTKVAIKKVLGGDDGPGNFGDGIASQNPDILYAHPEYYNVCTKIIKRLSSIKNNGSTPHKFAVLVGTGSFNPLTRMHLRRYYVAKQYLETSYLGFTVLGCLLSPSHATTVRERYKTNSSEILPSPHRLAIAQLLVEESNFISIDPWEITRRRPMDYLSLLEHTREMLRTQFSTIEIKVLYLCKGECSLTIWICNVLMFSL